VKNNTTAIPGTDYVPLSEKAQKELIEQTKLRCEKNNISVPNFLDKVSSKMNVDKRTLKKWWDCKEKVELKSRQRIETFLSDSFTSNTFSYLPNANQLFRRIKECSDYMIEAVWIGDMTKDKSKKIQDVYKPLEDLILEIHSDPNLTDLMDVVNREADLIERCEELYPTLEREFSIFYAACPQFMLKDKDIDDTSTVYTFCINIIPLNISGSRRPDDFAMMPRTYGLKNIRNEIDNKSGAG
tara:strand:- start:108 stop:830 length:723 start_codon:yes stop_codon:yes gene_type:complete